MLYDITPEVKQELRESLDALLAQVSQHKSSSSKKIARLILNLSDRRRECELWSTLINLDEENTDLVMVLINFTAYYYGHEIKNMISDEMYDLLESRAK